MEMARKLLRDDTDEPVGPVRSLHEDTRNSLAGLDKALRFALAPKDPSPDPTRERGNLTKRDFSAALDLVHQAAEAIRATEERAQAIAMRANEELEAAEARIQSAEARVRTAEARAKEAEARAKEYEEWLVRIHDVIVQEFPSRKVDMPTRGSV